MKILLIIQQLFTLLGSIGLFLFGMKLMSEALQKVAGQRMRSFISTLAQNPVKGIFSGVTVTAALQSSSAATVMVVGLSGAGLLTFRESFSLIMGANIGTTLKAWLLSAVGFSFDLHQLSLPVVAIGLLFLLSGKSRNRHWGEFMIGFALLFIGLEFIKTHTAHLAIHQALIDFMNSLAPKGFLSILFFVVLGTVLTALLQSSSAMMALTFALVSSGWVSFEMAAAMVLGENIGTTATANIAALVSDYRARRSALSHFIFNFSGVIVALILFIPLLDGIAAFTRLTTGNDPYTVATAIPIALAALHTFFNIASTLVWANFIPAMTTIVNSLMPGTPGKSEKHKYYNPYIISTGEFSLLQTKRDIAHLSQKVSSLFELVRKMLVPLDPQEYALLKENAAMLYTNIEKSSEEIIAFLEGIRETDMSEAGKQRYHAMLKIVDKLQNISKICRKAITTIDEKDRQKAWFTPKQRANLEQLFAEVLLALRLMNDYLSGDYHLADIDESLALEERINTIRSRLIEKIPSAIEKGKIPQQSADFYKELIQAAEKTGDLVVDASRMVAACRL
jgi:phosphate:Na+ symporter